MTEEQAELVVVSGPSGVGKTTIVDGVLKEHDRLVLSRSATTREPRSEDETEQYVFLSEDEFQERIETDAFLEWAEIFGDYYGTLKETIREIQEQNQIPVLEIDPQGARQIRETDFFHRSIFIEPPSFDTLKKRLRNRGSNTEEELQQRFQEAREEMKSIPEYDYRLVNDVLDGVIDRFLSIIDLDPNI